jgi:hypothetical protein
MYKTYSKKLGPPYSGQVQVVQSDTYRAMTLDGAIWELQFVNRAHLRVATITDEEIRTRSKKSINGDENSDPEIDKLIDFLAEVELPFPANDHYEFWVMDKDNQTPLAMVFSCTSPEHMSKFPSRSEWTALPDSVMPVTKTEAEIAAQMPPVNYRFESMVAERTGIYGKGQWFDRREHDESLFPVLLVSPDWASDEGTSLYTRYIERQAPRLLMLQGLPSAVRQTLEQASRPNAVEVARFYKLYPEIIDTDLISALRVQARIREASDSGKTPGIQSRRDGVLYI